MDDSTLSNDVQVHVDGLSNPCIEGTLHGFHQLLGHIVRRERIATWSGTAVGRTTLRHPNLRHARTTKGGVSQRNRPP